MGKTIIESLLTCSVGVVVFFLCSESTGHDHNHGGLGLANVSITWGKNKISAEDH